MKGSLRPRWKRVLFWTLFVYALLTLFMVRYRWTLDQQRRIISERLGERVGEKDGASPGAAPEGGPDASARQMPGDEVERQLEEVSREWASRPAEERQQALASRMEELSRMAPGEVEEMAEHLAGLVGAEPVVEKRVEIAELDLETAVPVNMSEEVDAEGGARVRIEMMDSRGHLAEIDVSKQEMTPEELQALEAYRLMNRMPALHRLRPLLAPLLRERLEEGE